MKNGSPITIIRYAFAHSPRPRTHTALLPLFALASTALALYLPVLVGRAIDLLSGTNKVNLAALSAILIRITAVICTAALCKRLIFVYSNRLLANVNPLSSILMRIVRLSSAAFTLLGALILMLYISTGTAVVVLLLAPAPIFAEAFISRRIQSALDLHSAVHEEQDIFTNEIIQGIKDVQAFGQESACEQRFEAVNTRMEKCSHAAGFLAPLSKSCARSIYRLICMSAAVLGAMSALTGGVSTGQLICLPVYASLYTRSFREIPQAVKELQSAVADATCVINLLDESIKTPEIEKEAA